MHLCDQIVAGKRSQMSQNKFENEPSFLLLGAVLVNGSSELIILGSKVKPRRAPVRLRRAPVRSRTVPSKGPGGVQ